MRIINPLRLGDYNRWDKQHRIAMRLGIGVAIAAVLAGPTVAIGAAQLYQSAPSIRPTQGDLVSVALASGSIDEGGTYSQSWSFTVPNDELAAFDAKSTPFLTSMAGFVSVTQEPHPDKPESFVITFALSNLPISLVHPGTRTYSDDREFAIDQILRGTTMYFVNVEYTIDFPDGAVSFSHSPGIAGDATVFNESGGVLAGPNRFAIPNVSNSTETVGEGDTAVGVTKDGVSLYFNAELTSAGLSELVPASVRVAYAISQNVHWLALVSLATAAMGLAVSYGFMGNRRRLMTDPSVSVSGDALDDWDVSETISEQTKWDAVMALWSLEPDARVLEKLRSNYARLTPERRDECDALSASLKERSAAISFTLRGQSAHP